MRPKNRIPTHPGEILQRLYLDDLGLSQTDLAKHLKWKPSKINEIVNKKRGISPKTALAFSIVFKTKPQFWLNLQANYDLAQVDAKQLSFIKPLGA